MSARPPPSPSADDASTGLPALRSWRAVYIAVTAIFVVWVGLLTWLTEAFS